MRVLGISGSLRRDSYNTALLRHVGDLLEAEGAEFEMYRGLRYIPAYDEDCDTEDAPEPVSRIREAVRDADAVFFVSPEYNSSVPGALKNALDWLSRPFADNVLRNKPVAVIGASSGMFGARVSEGEVGVSQAGERFDESGGLNEPNLEQEVHEVVTTLVRDVEAQRLVGQTGAGAREPGHRQHPPSTST